MVNISNRRIPDRAMQFAPFAALKGYYESIRKQERITEPRKLLSEDEAETISNTLNAFVNKKLSHSANKKVSQF